MIYALTKYSYDQIMKYMMGQACRIHGRNEKCRQEFWPKSLKGKAHLKVLGRGGGNIKTGRATSRIGGWELDPFGSGDKSVSVIQTFGFHKRQQVSSHYLSNY
jgi:hypothetical protein